MCGEWQGMCIHGKISSWARSILFALGMQDKERRGSWVVINCSIEVNLLDGCNWYSEVSRLPSPNIYMHKFPWKSDVCKVTRGAGSAMENHAEIKRFQTGWWRYVVNTARAITTKWHSGSGGTQGRTLYQRRVYAYKLTDPEHLYRGWRPSFTLSPYFTTLVTSCCLYEYYVVMHAMRVSDHTKSDG